MTSNKVKSITNILLATSIILLIVSWGVKALHADISNPHPTPPANSVTATMLKAGIISDSKVSSTAAITITKISGGSVTGGIPFNNGSALDTHSSLTYSSSTKVLQVNGGTIAATSTRFGGVGQTWPAAQCAVNQVYKNDGSGNLSCTNLTSATLNSTFTAGATLAIGDWVALGTDATVAPTTAHVAGTGATDGGALSSSNWYAFSTTTPAAATYVRDFSVTMRNPSQGSGQAATYVGEVRSDCSGAPCATVLTSVTLVTTSSNGCGGNTFTLPADYYVGGASTTWFTVRQTAGVSGNLLCQISGTPTQAFQNSSDGSSWAAAGFSNGESYTFVTTSKLLIYKASSASANYLEKGLLGIISTGGATGATVYVDTHGVSQANTSCTSGSQYFLNDAVGTIGTAAGSVSRKVGFCLGTLGFQVNIDNY